jgi:hypothetical protein
MGIKPAALCLLLKTWGFSFALERLIVKISPVGLSSEKYFFSRQNL